ncbi:LysM peptidoglycan-binding domain-containing protein [Flammeovirga sp. MY04]|uniref:LysM peptidoglycan-binding domain-containing protein n=1 Tax=Flammeovirga sp. MY04 TaxID=1191459 RepID=UPI0008063D98|nr:LysM peptidoglycan-binding domain-containing protein [Flammeovirga sp. MY04]ANQ48969.1 LysM peptidoglycan-binding domain-containing protein [Flammeovirga sp. MY04]
MKKINTLSLLIGATILLSSFNKHTDIISLKRAELIVNYQPYQDDNPYPIITNVQTKTVNGEEITLVDANAIPAFIAGPNQNLMLIANALGVDVKKIYKYNDMDSFDDLQEGHVYYLKAKKGKAMVPNHTVNTEKNLWEVSQKYGIKLKTLAKKNRMKADEPLARGRVLFLQKKRPKSVPPKVVDLPPLEEPVVDEEIQESETPLVETAAVVTLGVDSTALNIDPNSKTHVVQEGESLFTISSMYDVTMLELKEWNDIGDNLALEEGQVLVVGKDETVAEETIVIPTDQPAVEEQAVETIATDDSFEIMPANERTGNGTITVGETAVVAGAATVVAADALEEEAVETEMAAVQKHTVQPGEFYYGIARKYGVSARQLQEWNNNKELHPGDEVFVSNPSGNQFNSVASNSAIDATGAYSGTVLTHTVEDGETLASISAKYGISEQDIINQNKVLQDQGNYARLPMFLQIPQKTAEEPTYASRGPATTTVDESIYHQAAAEQPAVVEETKVVESTPLVAATTSTPDVSSAKTHKVAKGETLFAISRKYGIYHKDLISWNNLGSNGSINEGQVLRLTDPSSENGNTAPEYHMVSGGETLYSISKKYGVSINDIKKMNNMDSNTVKKGQRLRIK